jgi:hypothetical protein
MADSTITREMIEAAAAAIANNRAARGHGAPPISNVLAILPEKLLAEVLEDAEAALKAAPGMTFGSKRRPYYGAACLGLDGMGANLRLSDGSLELFFMDEELEQTNEEGSELYISRLAASEVIALRQWLIDYLPASETEISAGHGVTPAVSVTVPAAGSEERDFWLEAACQHGFEATSGGEHIPEYDPPAYFATEDEVLKLIAAAREQGRKDVLDALATGGARG